MMAELKKLQQAFISDCAANALLDNNIQTEKFLNTKNLNANALMEVYRNSTRGCIIEAMKLTYNAILKLVGEQFFAATCDKYIDDNIPQSANMDDYGKNFAEFLKPFEPTKTLPYLPDIAKLEWLFHKACLSNDAEKFEWQKLAELNPEEILQLNFNLSPSLRMVSSTYPIDKIWAMTQDEDDTSETIDISQHNGVILAIYRNGLKTEITKISDIEKAFLNALEKDKTLENAFEAASNISENAPFDEMLQKFISLGIICSY